MNIKKFFTVLTKMYNNIVTIMYLVLNVFIITIITIIFLHPTWIHSPRAFIMAFAIILAFILVALFPFCEWILKRKFGCKKIKRKEQIAIIEPILNEVHNKARALNPNISANIAIYIKGKSNNMIEANDINAFALGRNTICITEGLLSCPEDQIKAVLGHEFGHLAHHDQDIFLIVTVFSFIYLIIPIIILLPILVYSSFLSFLGIAVLLILLILANNVLSKIVLWLWKQSSLTNEYLADEFSFNLGYGVSLSKFLDEYAEDSYVKGPFEAMETGHSNIHYRVSRLQNLGCQYIKNIQ